MNINAISMKYQWHINVFHKVRMPFCQWTPFMLANLLFMAAARRPRCGKLKHVDAGKLKHDHVDPVDPAFRCYVDATSTANLKRLPAPDPMMARHARSQRLLNRDRPEPATLTAQMIRAVG